VFTATGFELAFVDSGDGSGSVTSTFGGLVNNYHAFLEGHAFPPKIQYDWRAAFAVINGDPNAVHYAASGGQAVTVEEIAGPQGCCNPETYTEIGLVYNFSGRVTSPSDENQTKGCDANTQCSDCKKNEPMARYSMHLLLASLHIEDTPISYNSPRGPSTDLKVVYNQREANQPNTFNYSNLGPKWTFGWLSYVTDDGPGAPSVNPRVYVRAGGTEVFGGFVSATQSYAPDKQTLAVLVRTSNSTYEKRFPDGSKEVFSQTDGATSYPRRLFLTSVVDATNNATILTYDSSLRITAITDSLGQSIDLTYGFTGDQWKITKVTDPFGRFATFEYTAGKLTKITDPIGIESQFEYEPGSDFIKTMTTPYGATTFTTGDAGNSARWLEATDPLGGKERVEYADSAPIPSSESPAPAGVYNSNLQYQNTFYWDKKAMAEAPRDYSKAQIIHWLARPDGKVSGIKHSEKKALESRVWYTYEDQTDPAKVGKNALPIKVARLLEGGAPQISQYSYNALGNVIKETDPVDRVKIYAYDTNNIDVLEIYQRNLTTGASSDPEDHLPADKIAVYTYDPNHPNHQRLTETDPAGQSTTYTYNSYGQVLTRTNAKTETTTYTYDRDQNSDSITDGYLVSIADPPFNGVSAVTSFTYDEANRVRTTTNEADQFTTTIYYDDIDRKTYVSYHDSTWEQFMYADLETGAPRLDVTGSFDRTGRFTSRHYNANRQMDSITDPLFRTTHYGWCVCGSLESITDHNGNTTTFHRDIQRRVYQKVFADGKTIDYLFEKTSRLKSATDALGRRTNYTYTADDNLESVSYTNSSGGQLSPPTAPVGYTYDNHNRVKTMIAGNDLTTYEYNLIPLSPDPNGGKLHTIDGPLDDDTISFIYDELGRTISQGIQGGGDSTAEYDSLGRVSRTENTLGRFDHLYDGVTPRLLKTTAWATRQITNYTYHEDWERRVRTIENLDTNGKNLSKFDYTYWTGWDVLDSWSRQLGTTSSERWFEYDDAQQLRVARNTSNPNSATQVNGYVYDGAGNRTSDSNFNPQGPPGNGTFHVYTPNNLNEIDTIAVQNGNLSWEVLLVYDLAGNLIDDGEGKTFEWDAANRLTAINYGSQRSEFTYDGLSRRVKIVEKAGSTVTSTKQFVWVGSTIAQERDSSNTVTRQYFREGEYGEKAYYYTRDHLGSIREMTNVKGQMVAQYDYDPYGQRTKLFGTADVDFGYTGHYHHAPSGLNLTLYRAYNPALGRWLSRDPYGTPDVMTSLIGMMTQSSATVSASILAIEAFPENLRTGPNLYSYVGNEPIRTTDKNGLVSDDSNLLRVGPFYGPRNVRWCDLRRNQAIECHKPRHPFLLAGCVAKAESFLVIAAAIESDSLFDAACMYLSNCLNNYYD
jgi:RHS repeat-associated protein